MYNSLDHAIGYAAQAHSGQLRKYSVLPYIAHPIEVLTILVEHSEWAVSEDMMVAAILHDVVEDTPVQLKGLEFVFGKSIAKLVEELTDVYTAEAYPNMNRKARKEAERLRLSAISSEAKSIKLADLISNTKSIVAADPGFSRVYLAEKAALLDLMGKVDPSLLSLAYRSLADGQAALVQHSLRP